MKKLTEVSVEINGRKTKIKATESGLFIETKIGDMKVSHVNSAAKTLSFINEKGEELSGVKLDCCVDTVLALFNCTKKADRSLYIFESYDEYLRENKKGIIGAAFEIDDNIAAYKYGVNNA